MGHSLHRSGILQSQTGAVSHPLRICCDVTEQLTPAYSVVCGGPDACGLVTGSGAAEAAGYDQQVNSSASRSSLSVVVSMSSYHDLLDSIRYTD